jgi:serine/threonine-protein kinase RsbW
LARLTLTIDSVLGDVALVGVAVHRICLHLGVSEVQAGEVELCVVEGATNAIRHAYHGQPGHTVSITICADRQRVFLEVSDSGTPMKPEQIERLNAGSDLSLPCESDRDLLQEAGRGLPIIHALMDKLDYRRDGHRNLLVMVKEIV